MKTHQIHKARLKVCASALLALATLARVAPLAANAAPPGTTFTYQGLLNENGAPTTGIYEFRFNLYATSTDIAPVTTGRTNYGVPVTNGLFTTKLDFGDVFSGEIRWLDIGARTNGSPDDFTPLSPREELTPTPYAMFATTAGTVTNGAIQINQLATAGPPSPGQVLGYNGSSLVWQPGGGSDGWALSGNGGTTSGDFLGTTDNQPLELRANNSRVLRLEPVSRGPILSRTYSVNIVGGHSANSVANGVLGGTIGGGGYSVFGLPDFPNTVSGDFGTVSGGRINHADGQDSTVSGGQANNAAAPDAVVGGGNHNNVSAGASVVSGGQYNQVDAGAVNAVIGGGYNNHIRSSAITATIPGGSDNTADGFGSLAAGVNSHANDNGSFVWGDGTGAAASIGANTFAVRASGGVGFYVSGGSVNIASDGTLSTKVLVINGADVAEPFEISRKDLPKGSVVIIDEDNPGRLRLSDRAYDKRVAGILSGANGVRAGICLSQQGFNDNGENVALSGRVYVLADASSGPIKPGDLLTTSSTPGRAMKAADYTKAQGAILGKAMSTLKKGQGMVLVLVSLQ